MTEPTRPTPPLVGRRFGPQVAAGVAWVVMGLSYSRFDEPGHYDPDIVTIRPFLWMIAGVLGILTAHSKRGSWLALTLMGALAAERLAVVVVRVINDRVDPPTWASAGFALTALALVWAVGSLSPGRAR